MQSDENQVRLADLFKDPYYLGVKYACYLSLVHFKVIIQGMHNR